MYLHTKLEDLPLETCDDHASYRHARRRFLSPANGTQSKVSVYEIPPGSAACPYHYHLKNEETFYILSGQGLLKTMQGDEVVRSGDLLHFPAGCEGAHKLTNTSETEPLIYLDFDIIHDLDVAVYPDSGKLGVWGKGVNRLYRIEENLDYYDGE